MIEWCSFPIKENPVYKSFLLLLSVILFSLIIGYSIDTIHGFLALLLLILSLAKYFIPTYYFLNQDKLIIRSLFFTKYRGWDYYSRYSIGNGGIFLSPFPKRSRLDSFRGDYLRFSKDVDRSSITSFIKEKVKVA